MEIKVTKTHKVTFSVQYFEGMEGGMDTGSYGGTVGTIQEAIVLLEQANALDNRRDWVIVAEVTTTVS